MTTSSPLTVEEIFEDYSGRHAALVRALTLEVDTFHSLCDPAKENLCLYGYPNGAWEVSLPEEEVPPEIPEPVLGINFARDAMECKNWLSLVAINSDSWLLSVAFFFGARLNRNERKRLFNLINDLPTVFEVMSERKLLKEKPSSDNGTKSRVNGSKISNNGLVKSAPKLAKETQESFDAEEEKQSETLCGSCGGNYGNSDEFWIGCDICEKWYHGKCVKITPAKAESIKQYKCPSCTNKGQ